MGGVLFLKGESQYNAMINYIDEIESGFRLAGFDTYMVDAVGTAFVFQIQELAKKVNIDLIFTCNAVITGSLFLFQDAHYITYLCDHPSSHRERLKKLNEKAIVFTCDRRHEKYIRKYCPNIKYVKYIPLSGSYIRKTIPYAARSREIVFTGTYSTPESKYKDTQRFQGVLQRFADHMIEDIIEKPYQDLEMCLENSLAYFQVEVSNEEFHELLETFQDIDAYARCYYRDKMIRALVENGLKVHVFGNGWENFEGAGRENLIIEKGNFYVAQKAVADAKISINIMPWFKEGFQERIATAMLSGAVAVTDTSGYIEENFEDGEDLVLYDLENLEELPMKVRELLEHPEYAENITVRARNRAKASMTWQHRTLEMIAYIQKCFSVFPAHTNEYGQALQIPYEIQYALVMIQDGIQNMNDLMSMIANVNKYDKVELCDMSYFYSHFLAYFMNLRANIPELTISEYVYDFLTNLTEDQIVAGLELLLLECKSIQCTLLSARQEEMQKEAQREIQLLKYQLSEANTRPNLHSQKMIIQKLKRNYQDIADADVQEILKNIEKKGFVEAYNQDFVEKYLGDLCSQMDDIQYDAEAEMWYAYWNGKRMYYPKDYSQQDVASAVNFVKLEQDEASPHRYLSGSFDVREGDVVIDAGVAEGNFALDVVERAQKIYLIECEHKWVEALQKTFEPWADKVVIIEKMLGDHDDECFASIDGFVEEGYVNFMKLDVEGAEIPSLKGAENILSNSKNIRCAVCAYHRKNAERDIRELLEEHHFYTTTTKGYMFFKEDLDSWIDGELRRGLVRAVKEADE